MGAKKCGIQNLNHQPIGGKLACMSFTHLHVHSNYTLLGGTASLESLVERAAADGMEHLALTDANSLIGAVAFSRLCAQNEIQPITGMALNLASPVEFGQSAVERNGQLILLATGAEGFRSLCRLSSEIQGSVDRDELIARGLNFERFVENAQGLICLCGGRMGWIHRALQQGDKKRAAQLIGRLAGIFDERFYLSLPPSHSSSSPSTPLPSERTAPEDFRSEIVALGERFGVATVAVQPIFTLSPEERTRLRLLAAIDNNCLLEDLPTTALPYAGDESVDLHWLNSSEMADRFTNYSDALAMTQTIAKLCAPALPERKPIWPVLKSPEDGQPIESPAVVLAAQAELALVEKYGKANERAHKRLEHELSIINQHEYAPLFLLVADIVKYAVNNDIPFSTRGSVANSLVAYCCDITTVDPIEQDLLFERFLNPERSDPPDIDLDFCSRRRDEVLNYVRERYGEKQVALVATISTMKPRSAIRETAKAHGLAEAAIKRLVKILPDTWHPDPRRRRRSTEEELLAKLTDSTERTVVEAAFGILGQPHHLSIHPGGIVVTPGPMTDYVPVHLAPKGFLTTQFEHTDVEAVGLLKLDLLGIRALTVLADATALVRSHYKADFRLVDIEPEDPKTAEMMAIGDTTGVFQCESSGAKRTLRQLQVKNIRDLAVANAFFKPGPATGGQASNFIRRYRGEEKPEFLHPSLALILGPTHGVLLFQEQVLRVAREIAGLTWYEADHLRRGMSKFRAHEMASMQARFVEGCQRNREDDIPFSADQAEVLWKQVLAFAGYGFNQGHATAYADLSYRSAYIKAHWPAAFFASRLANQGGFHHPAIYIAEAQQMGFDVRPPHVNHSKRKFSLAFASDTDSADEKPILWMGLGQVRSLRRRSVQAIIAERKVEPFADLVDLLRRVPLQQKEVRHLIQCGALDRLGPSRAALLAEWDSLKHDDNAHQMAFDFGFAPEPVAPESAHKRIEWEKMILGQPVSVHPVEVLARPDDIVPLEQIANQPGARRRVMGVRLPGWTGGKGSYFGDGRHYLIMRSELATFKPQTWQPIMLTGRWCKDEWGGGWFQVEAFEAL